MKRITIFCALLVFAEVLAVSPPGDVVGKLSIGYQGWFTCTGDNSPINIWYHWAGSVIPSPQHQSFELWPDVREYTKTYQTGYANLGNGQPAKLFSSYDDQTVQIHFQWIANYGIDVVSLQRFGANFGDPRVLPYVNGITQKVMLNAVNTNRKFYIQWDISGWTNFDTELKTDWFNYVQNFTKSPAYAKQNGKPVVCIWGLGFLDRPGNVTQALDIINFLKNNGLYVIGGVPKNWLNGASMQPGFLIAYNALNMINP